MSARRTWTLAFALCQVAGVCGCEAVPSISFESAASEAGADGSGDGGDAGEAGCPDTAPQNATCCGKIPCYGLYCTPANCVTCSACSPPDVCCSKMNNVVCGATCH